MRIFSGGRSRAEAGADGRRRKRAWLGLVALPLAVMALAMAAAPVASAGTTYYAIGKRACKTPKKLVEVTCFADVREVVKRGTKGARAFTLAGGATGNGTIGPAGGLTPSDFATAYGLTTTGGSGQTVAIVIWNNDPNIASDLATFDTHYGLPAPPSFKVVNQSGASSPLPANDTSGASVEETLDVEAVHSICHGCNIVVVEANTATNSDLAIAENTAAGLAGIVNNSWGGRESGTDSTLQAAFNHPGKVITASTGDDGYYFYDRLAAIDEPSVPASYNTVVAVGGTSLFLGQNGTYSSESVWNDNGIKDYYQQNFSGSPLGAAGGGCSTLFTAQGWQTHLGVWSSTACGTKRLDADVSAVADYLTGFDIYDSYNCGVSPCPTTGTWLTLGGTSLASPLIAGVYGLAGGAHGISYPALTLYGHPNTTNDVTAGGDGWCDGEGAAQCGDPNTLGFGTVDCDYTASLALAAGDRACDALAGFDGPTGVGTPKGLTAFTPTSPAATISGPALVSPGTAATFNVTVKDPFPGGTPSTYTWNWGDGTANTVKSSTAFTDSESHTYTTGGVNRTITLSVKDNYGITGTKTFVVSVCCSANGSGAMNANATSVVHATTAHTITFTYTPAAGGMSGGAVTLAVPSGWSLPSTTGTAAGYTTASAGTVSVSGSTITVSGLTRGSAQPFTITYGSRAAGGPGATSPSTAVGAQTWQAREKSTSSGTLTNLASSPVITVT